MKIFKLLFVVSILLNIFFLLFLIRKKIYQHNILNVKTYYEKMLNNKIRKQNYEYRNDLFEVLPNTLNSVVFIGSSLTQNFEVYEFFQFYNVKNRGISGDNINGLKNRLRSIEKLNPKKVFVEIGINDLTFGHETKTIISNYKDMLDVLYFVFKDTEIYIQSIFPVQNKVKSIDGRNGFVLNNEIEIINNQIKSYAESKGFFFVNIHEQFLLNGEMNPGLSSDGIHLNSKGYFLWSEILKSYVVSE